MSLMGASILNQGGAASGGGFTPKCYNLGSGTDLYLTTDVTATGLSNGDAFTFVLAFELPDMDFVGAATYTVAGGPHCRLKFTAYEGDADSRPLTWIFSNGSAIVWEGKTTTWLDKATKYSIALSYEDGVRAQCYLNGVSETVASETDNGGSVILADTLMLGTFYDLARFYPIRASHFWVKDASDDLSSVLSNYVTGGTTPVDNANSCQIYMKMDDLVNDGSTSLTFTAPNGTPANENW